MGDVIRIGIIGAGANTRSRHIPSLAAIDGVRIVCVANRSVESGRKVAAEFDIPTVHSHWMDVVNDPDVDAVCIGTWPYLHAPAAIAALEMGKHVLTEARMAMTTAEAREMLDAAQQSGRVAQVVPSPFGLAGERVVRELIADGHSALGEVREIVLRALNAQLADPAGPLHWRQRADLSGVNVLMLGIYYETLMRWFGLAESVVAQAATFIPRRLDPATGAMGNVDIPDSIAVLARMAGGAQAVMHFSGQAHLGGGPRLEAYGSRGTLVYDFNTDTLSGAAAGAKELAPIPIPPAKRGGWRVEADFIDSIRDGRPVTHTSFADGVRYMAFTEAARLSAEAGRRVALSEV